MRAAQLAARQRVPRGSSESHTVTRSRCAGCCLPGPSPHAQGGRWSRLPPRVDVPRRGRSHCQPPRPQTPGEDEGAESWQTSTDGKPAERRRRARAASVVLRSAEMSLNLVQARILLALRSEPAVWVYSGLEAPPLEVDWRKSSIRRGGRAGHPPHDARRVLPNRGGSRSTQRQSTPPPQTGVALIATPNGGGGGRSTTCSAAPP